MYLNAELAVVILFDILESVSRNHAVRKLHSAENLVEILLLELAVKRHLINLLLVI